MEDNGLKRVVIDLPDKYETLFFRAYTENYKQETDGCYAGLADRTHIVMSRENGDWKVYEEGVADESDFRH